MAKSLAALMQEEAKKLNLETNSNDTTATPSHQQIEVRDVVTQAQTAEALEVFLPKNKQKKGDGDYVTIGNYQLAINTALSPEDLKFVPKSENYVDNNGILEDIARFIDADIPVLVEGATGVGKTSAFRHLAAVTQSPYRRLNLNGSTTVDEFVGKVMLNANGTYWQDGVLIDAMRKGHWLVLDEVNAALPEILFALHSLLDDDRMVVLSENDGEVVRPHTRFRVFATMNPSEGGYSGTKELNTAFISRFVKTTFGYPTVVQERKMVNGRHPNLQHLGKDDLTEMLKFASETRVAQQKGASEFCVSPRDLLQWVNLVEVFEGDITKSADYSVVNKAPSEERQTLRDLIKMRFGMGMNDYIKQCSQLREYEVGDQVVVSITTDERSDLASDFTGLYEVLRKDLGPTDMNGRTDISRTSYELKCLGKNQNKDFMEASNGNRVYLARFKTAKYHAVSNKTA